MGNKRKHEDEEAYIARKIQKLERRLRRKRRLPSIDSESVGRELKSASPKDHSETPTSPNEYEVVLDTPEIEEPDVQSTCLEGNLQSIVTVPGPSTAPVDTLNVGEELEIEESLLQLLGDAPLPEHTLGDNIHKDISTRWQNILSKGLKKEIRELILKKYLIPANCSFLIPPVLNPEAKAAVPDIIVKRDNTIMQKQSQIGIALAALSQLTEKILKNETSQQELLQPLSDACRLLCDSHFLETMTRRSIIMSAINSNLRETLADTDRDKYLFNEELTEKIRMAKTVQKTGQSLTRANMPQNFNNKTQNFRYNQKSNHLNSKGPIQRKPPGRANEAARGRAAPRNTRLTAYQRQAVPPPQKTQPPVTRNYRR